MLALAVSALSMTITKTKVTKTLRLWVKAHNAWLGELLSCPYCTSHWLAFAVVAIYQPRVVDSGLLVLDLFISAMMIVALAAVMSGLIFRSIAAITEPN